MMMMCYNNSTGVRMKILEVGARRLGEAPQQQEAALDGFREVLANYTWKLKGSLT